VSILNLPRWTVYPALALLIGIPIAIVASGPAEDPFEGAAAEARGAVEPVPARSAPASAAPAELPPSKYPRVVVLGVDGLDPDLLETAMERFPERTRNFQWLARNGVHRLGTSTPPQSPVAWSNFITGLDPGGHGIFDFIHRNTRTRGEIGSTLEEVEIKDFDLWGDWKLPLTGEAGSNRSGTPFWARLREAGIPADIWRMPINIPVERSKGVSFPGMATPALDSAYGKCTVYTTDALSKADNDYSKLVIVDEYDGRVDTSIEGPPNAFKQGEPHTRAPLKFYVDRKHRSVVVDTGAAVEILRIGEWSGFMPLAFDMQLPDFGMMDVTGVARFYVRAVEPDLYVYASAVNIDPLAPAMPVSEPDSASADLADAIGTYYTQGMAEDVNALKSELLSVEEFMYQVSLVYDERRRMMDYALDRYAASEDGGLLFFYYSTVDLTSHMMWRHADEQHPHHDPAIASRSSEAWSGREGSTWRDTIYDLILKIDPVLAELRDRLGDDVTYVVMSDHGFAPYRREFSLNTWLLENGYLVLKEPHEVLDEDGEPELDDDGNVVIKVYDRELPPGDPAHVPVKIGSAVDWSRTRAYGVGFNGLYLNLAGREQDNPDTEDVDESGIVQPGAEAEALARELKAKLEALVDPKDGTRVVTRCDLATEVYHGDRVSEAPDLIVGYNTGYGNSDAASQGQIPYAVLQDNVGGTFNGSHLMDPAVVPGTLLSNVPVLAGDHRLQDLTVEILRQYGLEPGPGMNASHRVLQ